MIKNIYIAALGLIAFSSFSQKLAKTGDGEAFLIYPNGTWKHAGDSSSTYQATKPLHFSAAMPAVAMKPVLIKHAWYAIGYDEQHRVPYWTYYHLTSGQVNNDTLDRVGDFVSDPKTSAVQGNDNDYKASGYDKGHMVPCEDMSFDSNAMSETFYYSNCVPQTSKLNRGQWKNLEQLTRNWAIDNGAVEVFSGVVPGKSLPPLGASKVMVPSSCYKIVLDYSQPGVKAIAFVMPNQDKVLDDVQQYACSIDYVESLTGIDFFLELPDDVEKSVEASFDTKAWNWDLNAHKPKAGHAQQATEEAPPVKDTHSGSDKPQQAASVQCSATTQKGERCKRMTTSPNGKCAQHGGN